MSYFTRLIAMACAGILLFGCSSNLLYKQHVVETHSQAGSFTVAATMIDLWDNFIDELSPGFKLLEQKALEAAIPRTTVSEKQMLDSLAVALKLAPPKSGLSGSEEKVKDAEGKIDKTEKETKTTESGDLSNVTTETVPGTTLTQQEATKLPDDTVKLGIDPFLSFTAASALYQEVKLLNNAVRAAARRHNMVPYILRLQLNNVPSARHQPYDTYALISMFAREVCNKSEGSDEEKKSCTGVRKGNSNTGWKDREAVVVPLLVTDNLESQLSSRSSNTVRQIAMAASILQGGFAASLGLTRKTEELNAVLGNDLNSLMTVGRPASSSLHVRLGAMLEATAHYAMVPRNYSVTVLVLVPEDSSPGDMAIGIGDIEGLRITGTVTYRNVETGEALPRMQSSDRDQIVRYVLEEFGFTGAINERRTAHLRVATYVNDYAWFREILNNTSSRYGNDEPVIPIGAPADLWNALLEVNVSTGYFGADVHLPKSAPRALPPSQTFVMLDDGSSAMKGTLAGAHDLGNSKLRATLEILTATGTTIKMVTAPATSDSNGNITLQFPSLAAYGVKPSGTGTAPVFLPGSPLTLVPVEVDSYESQQQPTSETYEVAYLVKPKKPATKPAATFTVQKTAVAVTADQTKRGNIQLHIDFQKGLSAAQGDYLELAINGADLTAASGANVAPTVNFGKAKVIGNGTAILNLSNLIAGTKIEITASGKDSADKPKGGKVELEVDVK